MQDLQHRVGIAVISTVSQKPKAVQKEDRDTQTNLRFVFRGFG